MTDFLANITDILHENFRTLIQLFWKLLPLDYGLQRLHNLDPI